jgi:glycosyltransferase involved in cell wall biosynthesis
MPDLNGLSILIPVYNYDVRQLTKDLIDQGQKLIIPFEILCFDDASALSFKTINKEVAKLANTTLLELPENIGRAKIRNKLAHASKYNKLLFLDCDSAIVKKDFLLNYLTQFKDGEFLIGGTVYGNEPSKEFSLRWKFGKLREERSAALRSLHPYDSIHINNLLADKNVYLQHQLDENIITYGHEDTKLGYSLKRSGVTIKHIDNPV